MGYTNGFHIEDVKEALKGRLAWKAPDLNSENSSSDSGRFFDDGSFHPVVTVENIKACSETKGLIGEELDNHLIGMKNTVIMQAMTSVFNGPELKDNTKLFERNLNNDTAIPNAGNFVFIRFTVPKGYAVEIKTLYLFFNGAADFSLYLYKDGKTEPVWSEFIAAQGGEIEEFEPNDPLIMRKPGMYYLGYYQDDLGDTRAMDESKCWLPTRIFGYAYGQAKKQGADFDRSNVGITSLSFGLNCEVISFKDHTDSIVRNAAMFDNLLGLQMAYNVAKEFLHTNRSNAEERKQKDALIAFEADGAIPVADVPKTDGLKGKIAKEVARLQQTFFPKAKAQIVSVC